MLAGNIASVWQALDMKGYYLPHLSSSFVISEYLLEDMRGKVFRIEKKGIQKCTLLQKHQNLIQTQTKGANSKGQLKDLGFTVGNLPNKEWLTSVLYALNPMDQVFQKPKIEDVGLVIKEDLEMLKQLDTTLFRSKKPGFLKRTEEQRIAIAEKKSEQNCSVQSKRLIKRDLILLSLLANMKNNLKRGKKLNKIKDKLDADNTMQIQFCIIKKKIYQNKKNQSFIYLYQQFI